MITPFPVPIHNLHDEMRRAVMRTNEKPNFPVPTTEKNTMEGFNTREAHTCDS